jgi:NADH-quinone oxidoreductase subunit C
MADENKSSSPPPPGNEQKPGAGKQSGSVEPLPPADKPAPVSNPAPTSTSEPKAAPAPKPAGPEKAGAAPPTKPPAAAAVRPKPTGPVPVAWESEMVNKLKGQYGSGIEALTYLEQNYIVADSSLTFELLQVMRDEEEFGYCVDVTAVHYPKREKQFDLVWILYSFPRNERVRVKTMIAENETFPTVSNIWPTANWLEREVFDMFGIKFEGHPDMKRILLPDGWKGHPLRKDYGIIEQDKEWVQINLGIESGQ